jgi:hypothetical protein
VLNVLVATAPLPHRVSPNWDLCLAWKPSAILPRLPREWQGWLGAERVTALASAIDGRARSRWWATMAASADSVRTEG